MLQVHHWVLSSKTTVYDKMMYDFRIEKKETKPNEQEYKKQDSQNRMKISFILN